MVSYQYTDFGETSIYGDTDFYNEICYNEAVYDKSTGLYYLNARYYDPADGRFISRDSYRGSLTNPSTQHLYAYCANNPVNYEDPSGHIAISRIVGGIVGAAAGFLGGRAIAKKTNAKGWKKWAIIAGCTVGGAAVGAIAGPRVAKAAKKAVRYVKKKLPTRNVIKTKISKFNANVKANVNRIKSSVRKGISKVKQAVSKGKPKNSVVKNKLNATTRDIGQTKKNTVWDSIKPTQGMREGTKIPKSFEMTTSRESFWVHPNATKHMAEYITRNPMSHNMPINSQELLSSFHSAVNSVVNTGIQAEKIMNIGNWELIFSQPRAQGLLKVIKHAVYIP